jgi:anti-sigma regulatory factor (Ser/Thr protein kinase)
VCASTPRQELVLPLVETAPGAARAWLRVVTCREHGVALLSDATLLVSELVTNAVQHGGPPVVLAVDCDETALHVRVRDGSPVLPEPRDARADAENGRGYVLLEALSERWGVEPESEGAGGKEVWFLLGADPGA